MKKVTSVAGMREAEKRAIPSLQAEIEVIGRVAAAALCALDSLAQKKTAILCGKGNNGGDGYALALLLPCATVYSLFDDVSPAAEYYKKECGQKGIERKGLPKEEYEVLIDCVCGVGFHGIPRGAVESAVKYINAQSGAVKVAMDVPTGLNANSGEATQAVVADITLTVAAVKVGLLIGDGRKYAGSISVLDCGLDVQDILGEIPEKEDFARLLRPRSVTGAKNEYGYAGVMGGCAEYAGAPTLAASALAALRSGAGVSRAIVPSVVAPVVRFFSPEVTVKVLDDFSPQGVDEALKGLTSLALGMGWGRTPDRVDYLRYILQTFKGNLVLDADALFALGSLSPNSARLAEGRCVLTPHAGEFKRLFKEDLSLPALIKAAKDTGAVVLGKGATTIITNGEKTYFVTNGASGMATAGSGDVLSGVIAAFTAYQEPLIAATMAAMVAGLAGEEAARKYGNMGMLSGDTLKELAYVTRELTK